MNVLIFVFALLMLLASLSYSSMQQLKQSLHTHTEYRRYLQADVDSQLDKTTLSLYDKQTVKELGESNSGGTRLQSKLSLGGLVNSEKRLDEIYGLSLEIFKRLIPELYGQHAFYQELLRRQAEEQGLNEEQVLVRLIEAIAAYSEQGEEGRRVSKNKDLLKTSMDDALLRNAFAKMLNGRDVPASEAGGYPSLLSFITVEGASKLSLYLAKPAMLRAIFQDQVAVDRIMEGRMEIYRQLRNDPPLTTKEDGQQRLERLTDGSGVDSSEQGLFDFAVSTTRPPSL